ncbi:hypothetical protein EJB05_13847, partial [Eragrostis curvula]
MSGWCPVDALHGRILFSDYDSTELFVSSPVPGEVRRLPVLLHLGRYSWSAALLCATAGCDHLDCSGAFVVVLVGTYTVTGTTSAYIYSSEQHEWSTPTSIKGCTVEGVKRPSARVGNTVYFICKRSTKLLAYELCKREVSFVSIPSTCWSYSFTVFATADEGRLGFATAEWFRLFTWSREAGSLDGDAGWTQQRVFEIDKLLPSSTLSYQYDFFATTNSGVIVVKGNSVLFAIDLKSGEMKKLLDGSAVRSISDVVPYIGFCTPSSHQYNFASICRQCCSRRQCGTQVQDSEMDAVKYGTMIADGVVAVGVVVDTAKVVDGEVDHGDVGDGTVKPSAVVQSMLWWRTAW